MAWLKCFVSNVKKAKLLSFNRTNFPSSREWASGTHSDEISVGHVYTHTTSAGSDVGIETGFFDCSGYSQAFVNVYNNSWGNGTTGANLYCDYNTATNTNIASLGREGGWYTLQLNGASQINLRLRYQSTGSDVWVDLTMSEIKLVP